MNAARLLLIITTLLLAGCLRLPQAEPAPVQFDLGPLENPPPEAPHAMFWDVKVNSPVWLEDIKILYRQGRNSRYELRSFPGVRWVAAPEELLQYRLRAAMAAPVGQPARQGQLPPAVMAMRVQLENFLVEQAPDGKAKAQVSWLATAWSRRDRQILGARRFTTSTPVDDSSAAKAVAGLAEATDQALGQMLPWMNQLEHQVGL
jgi:cholesterol transport system auxiliary component